jgi:hypothetical protein
MAQGILTRMRSLVGGKRDKAAPLSARQFHPPPQQLRERNQKEKST